MTNPIHFFGLMVNTGRRIESTGDASLLMWLPPAVTHNLSPNLPYPTYPTLPYLPYHTLPYKLLGAYNVGFKQTDAMFLSSDEDNTSINAMIGHYTPIKTISDGNCLLRAIS
ncbi:hypothetical protein DPMN_092585 [Dreissena polymorpha]|uniref:OTU domain-containing protein n=1 Tax=Dreissena polymorpha TaxID=45954 RepID=A0A9D4L2L7_DREPO|nr:hypothetical protein DPMN_092585 [Dreissena polymorpha]